MNTPLAQPQPLKGLLALLLAIPFLRAACAVFRRPASRKPTIQQPHREAAPTEQDIQAKFNAICEEIKRLFVILQAQRAAEAARAQQKRARRALAANTATSTPVKKRARARAKGPAARQTTPKPSPSTPTTPKPRDKGSG